MVVSLPVEEGLTSETNTWRRIRMDQTSGSGDVAGWARVQGKCGWKPTMKVCIYVLALSRYCHIRHVLYLLDCRR